MKALTLWRPWPWAIFHAPHNPKRIENRPWKPWARIIEVPIALHAGKTFDSDAADHLCSMYGIHPDGNVPPGWTDEGLIGVATVTAYATSAAVADDWSEGQGRWFSGPYAWLLTKVRALKAPIPCKGKQGLWQVPDDVEARVYEALR